MKNHLIIFASLLAALFVLTALALPQAGFAQAPKSDYTPISPLPDVGTCNSSSGSCDPIKGNFSSYISGIFNLTIAIAGALAVIVIIWEGIMHMTSESFTSKSNSTQRIQAAVGGLLLALLAFLILQAINPHLVDFNLNLDTLPVAQPQGAPAAPSAGGSTTYHSSVSYLAYPDTSGNVQCPPPPAGYQFGSATKVFNNGSAITECANRTEAVLNDMLAKGTMTQDVICCLYVKNTTQP